MSYIFLYISYNFLSEWGIALTGYVVPGCVEDGTWMLWENSSAVVVIVAVAHSWNYVSPKLKLFADADVFLSFVFISYQNGLFWILFKNVIFENGDPPEARFPRRKRLGVGGVTRARCPRQGVLGPILFPCKHPSEGSKWKRVFSWISGIYK